MEPMKRVTTVRTEYPPVFNGIGDALLLAWIAEGAKGSQHEVRLHATGVKRQALEVVGCPLHDRDEGIELTDVYRLEQRRRSTVTRIASAAGLLGIKTPPRRPQVKYTAKSLEFARQFWDGTGHQKRILLCPDVNDHSREWPWWDHLRNALDADGFAIRELTTESCDESFWNVAAIQATADLIVAVDSAHAHMAATVGTPTIVLQGPTSHIAFSHAGNVRCLSVTPGEQHCVGCCFNLDLFGRSCIQKGCAAMTALTPGTVLAEIHRMERRPQLIYETYAQLAARVRDWSQKLPEFVAVAGVPRAGQIVAGMLAAERNIHLVQLEDLLAGREPWKEPLRRNCSAKGDGKILVVDDTVSSGQRMAKLRKQLTAPNIKFGAVYGMDSGLQQIDYFACRVGQIDHLFEWCWQHHWFVEKMLFDLDGVLCADWTHPREDGDLTAAYEQHMENAPCLMRPSFSIGEIVTARLEKYRTQTETWLRKHKIPYKVLTMAPYDSPQERSAQGGFAERKAAIYRDRPWAMLFVESCPHQAGIIASLTSMPVLSWPKNELLNGVTL